jgi:hypothetical protein
LAAVPPEPETATPDATRATKPRVAEREAPVLDPGTEFRYGKDDDLGSFMDDMVKDRPASPGPADRGAAGGPEARATPPATRVIRASAAEAVVPATAYYGRAPVVTLAMPPDLTRLPLPNPAPPQLVAHDTQAKTLPPPPLVEPGRAPGPVRGTPALAPPVVGPSMVAHLSVDGARSTPAPAPVDPDVAGRAPGVVWGMPDLPPTDGPSVVADASMDEAPAPDPAPVDTSLAGRAPGVIWGMPDRAPPPDAPSVVADASVDGARPVPAAASVHTSLAGRAPGVVWGMPDMPPASAGLPTASRTTRVADAAIAPRAAPLPGPLKPAAPAEMVLAGEVATPVPPALPPRQVAPPAPAPTKPALLVPVETVLAGDASDPVWAVPTAMSDAPAGPSVGAEATPAPALMMAGAPVPAPAKPPIDGNTPQVEPVTVAAVGEPQPRPRPVAAPAGIEVAPGLIDVGFSPARDAALGSIPFGAESALLTPDAVVRLAQLLAGTAELAARIKIVGEGDAPALALDRALAVGLALVQGGVPADRLELTLAHGGSGDQARLFLTAPEL